MSAKLHTPRIFGFNEEKHQKIMGLDCALLGCLWVPDADEYVARLISDWLQWVRGLLLLLL